MHKQRKEHRQPFAETRAINILGPVLIVIAGLAAYSNSFSAALLFDDHTHVIAASEIRDLSDLGSIVLGQRRPVVSLTLATNYALGGQDVFGYHVLNLLVHLAAGLTLYALVRRTLIHGTSTARYAAVAPRLATVIALIWVAHPLQTQSVTYVIQRAESLMGLFYLLTLYCVVRGVTSHRQAIWYALAIASCALAMGSKAVAVTAPVVVLLYDRMFLSASWRDLLRNRWWMHLGLMTTWLVLFAVGVITGVLDPRERPETSVGFAFKGITPWQYLLTQQAVILHYLRLAVLPIGLCLDYAWPVTTKLWPVLPHALLLVSTLGASVWAYVRGHPVGFVGLAFFLILAPTSSIVPIRDPAFEHRMYLPLAAVATFIVAAGHDLIHRLQGRFRFDVAKMNRAATALMLAIVVALTFATHQRNRVYHSAISMWGDVVSKRPENARAWANFGMAYVESDKPDDGLRALKKAAQLNPHRAGTFNGLGIAYASLGRDRDALDAFEQALRIRPGYASVHLNAATLLASNQDPWRAAEHYRRVLDKKPRHRTALLGLGRMLLKIGDESQALQVLQQATAVDPNSAAAYNSIGIAWRRLGGIQEATQAFERARLIDPNYASAEYNLGLALADAGDVPAARDAFSRALELDPSHQRAKKAMQRLPRIDIP